MKEILIKKLSELSEAELTALFSISQEFDTDELIKISEKLTVESNKNMIRKFL